MEKTADAILTFAAQCAQEAWDDKQQPYLLARLSPDLIKVGVNYKEVLGEQRLKDFLRSAPDRVKIVAHPSQKAKIGLIPSDKEFEYDVTTPPTDTKPATSSPIEKGNGSRRRYIVTNFLLLLAELDDADAAQVQIPTHILTKLMRDR